uniref:Subtilisin-like protease n=1 Tax=Manihot esculenta TaxID=3983 RepID=A0A2C9VZK0_MANES
MLDEQQAEQLKNNPNVQSVFLNRKYELYTTHSWEFLGLENNNGAATKNSIWKKAKYGQDVIIANLDTAHIFMGTMSQGVWPESKSFNDEGMGPVPSRWKGFCQTEGGVRCNRKLIGARYFYKGLSAEVGPNTTELSARDTDGHGTHTLSTAGGNFVPGASIFGYGNGTAKGGSPKARVAAYKVCWADGCFSADILAGIDAAISDGVDVLSLSLGGAGAIDYNIDVIAIGALAAVSRGMSVVASAGNDGPDEFTSSNVAPWVFTIGASTMDRDFTNFVILGNDKSLKGTSLSDKALPAGKSYPLISAADAKASNSTVENATLCGPGTLDPHKAAGKIIVCLRGGDIGRPEKGIEAARAGAIGMIIANDQSTGNEIIADPHILPASHINYTDGLVALAYLNSTKNATASISSVKTELGINVLAPEMAAFSSRGPNSLDPEILKPDITAPGVNVLAAYSEAVSPSDSISDERRSPFNIISGTSMSCPHVAGIVGLLKSLHPDWSSAAIKSAIMTTATTKADNGKHILDADGKNATPFAYGAGHVQPNRAADPGLVYDLIMNDYLNLLCHHKYNISFIRTFGNNSFTCPKHFSVSAFNYPSITVPNLKGSTTISRRVKNVGSPGTYNVHVLAPPGISIEVEPESLTFSKAGEEKIYKVTLKPIVNSSKHEGYVYGELLWSDKKHKVKTPLVIKIK